MLHLVTGKELEGRYVIQGNVGSGGYGSVFRAADKQLNREVALKRLLKYGATSASDELKQLLAEAQKHAQLVHANIVQVYDVIECEGEHLIVMEYVDGPSLATLLRDQARNGQLLPLDKAVSILRDVLSGVAFAHDKLIVHRDLSPSNILLTSTSIPKISDFGIARLLKTDGADGTVDSSHGATGNPNYMSPEQQRGEQADQSSDLFMIGIVGYLLLSGRHPFAHPSGLFVISELIADENYAPETLKPATNLTTSQQRLFREYSAVIMRLLNRERAGRFTDARESIAALEAVTPFQECPQCGERLPEHFRFCGFCGSATSASAGIAAQPISGTLTRERTADELVEEGFLLSQQRRWGDAIGRYQQALKLDPENQKAFRNLGFALNRIGRFDEAESVLSKGLELEAQVPAHEASVLYERAYARAELKKYDGALEDANRALQLSNYPVKSLYLRARIHLYRGVTADAKRDAYEVLRSVPDHVGALRLLDQIG